MPSMGRRSPIIYPWPDNRRLQSVSYRLSIHSLYPFRAVSAVASREGWAFRGSPQQTTSPRISRHESRISPALRGACPERATVAERPLNRNVIRIEVAPIMSTRTITIRKNSRYALLIHPLRLHPALTLPEAAEAPLPPTVDEQKAQQPFRAFRAFRSSSPADVKSTLPLTQRVDETRDADPSHRSRMVWQDTRVCPTGTSPRGCPYREGR